MNLSVVVNAIMGKRGVEGKRRVEGKLIVLEVMMCSITKRS
jgi:hypothetical protein